MWCRQESLATCWCSYWILLKDCRIAFSKMNFFTIIISWNARMSNFVGYEALFRVILSIKKSFGLFPCKIDNRQGAGGSYIKWSSVLKHMWEAQAYSSLEKPTANVCFVFFWFAVCDQNRRHLPTDFIHKFLVFTVVLALVGVLWLWILWRAVFFIETAENWI